MLVTLRRLSDDHKVIPPARVSVYIPPKKFVLREQLSPLLSISASGNPALHIPEGQPFAATNRARVGGFANIISAPAPRSSPPPPTFCSRRAKTKKTQTAFFFTGQLAHNFTGRGGSDEVLLPHAHFPHESGNRARSAPAGGRPSARQYR